MVTSAADQYIEEEKNRNDRLKKVKHLVPEIGMQSILEGLISFLDDLSYSQEDYLVFARKPLPSYGREGMNCAIP